MAGVAEHLKGFPRRYAAVRAGSTAVNVVASSPPRARAARPRARGNFLFFVFHKKKYYKTVHSVVWSSKYECLAPREHSLGPAAINRPREGEG
jgi:hypothetical protein